jgi:PIN domain nuclease of toxin-antitoxin system
MLVENKRMALTVEMDKWLENAKREPSLREAPLTWEVAKEPRSTLADHRDPADRFLVATAGKGGKADAG